MKKLLAIIAFLCPLLANAQDYLINFRGTGLSVNVTTVKIENLTAGTSLIMNGSDILHLTSILTGVKPAESTKSPGMKLYPNPTNDHSTIEIYPPVAGEAIITISEMTGVPVAQIKSYLEISRQDFIISGLGNDFYLINVKGNGYQFSGKLISNSNQNGTIRIESVNKKTLAVEQKTVKTDRKVTHATIDMAYTAGDRLKYTGISGNYITVKTDIPVSDITVSFNFIACTDWDNNSYPVVEMGTQIWMAENLKAVNYNDGTAIPLATENSAWVTNTNGAYCDYDNNTANSDKYGKLYNWYVGGYDNTKNVCPIGWHVPTQLDWGTLLTYLTNTLFYDNITDQYLVGKSLASTTNWASSTVPGSPGTTDYPEFRNKTGFTALPGGFRSSEGTFSEIGFHTYWWTPSDLFIPNQPRLNGKSISIDYDRVAWGYYETFKKNTGFSLRCMRD